MFCCSGRRFCTGEVSAQGRAEEGRGPPSALILQGSNSRMLHPPVPSDPSLKYQWAAGRQRDEHESFQVPPQKIFGQASEAASILKSGPWLWFTWIMHSVSSPSSSDTTYRQRLLSCCCSHTPGEIFFTDGLLKRTDSCVHMCDGGFYIVNKWKETALYLLRFAVRGALCNDSPVIVLAKSMMLMMTFKGTCFCYFSLFVSFTECPISTCTKQMTK